MSRAGYFFRFAIRGIHKSYGNYFHTLRTKCCLNYSPFFSKTFCSVANCDLLIKDTAVQDYLDFKYEKLNQMADKERNSQNVQVLKLFSDRMCLKNNLKMLAELEKEQLKDKDFKAIIEEEKLDYEKQIREVEYKIIESLSSEDEDSSCKGLIFEICPGVGGQEAMLFAKSLFDMYCNYIQFKGWKFYVAEEALSQLGGVRHASIIVEGEDVFSHLKFESGVHRVQRVPSTEKSGRVHTSTVTVAVIPQPEDVIININEKDLIIETKRASGAGGQHVNTTDSAVRITHVPSGIVIECQTERSQIRNRGIALTRLKAKLYQQELEEKNNNMKCVRKSQVGAAARSDKIRTYNFQQDRITDHRLSGNIHNLPEFLKGGNLLDQLIQALIISSSKEKFSLFIQNIRNKD